MATVCPAVTLTRSRDHATYMWLVGDERVRSPGNPATS